MKGSSIILSIVALIAVAVLYVLHFSGDGNEAIQTVAERTSESDGAPRIAYIKADSVIVNYELAQVLGEEFTKMQEAYNTEFNTRRQSFEEEATAFQEKLQSGGFLTEQRAIQERDRLVGIEQEVLRLDQDLSTKLSDLQTANNNQITDSLLNYLEEFNAEAQYDYIFSGASVLIGAEAHNITAVVLEALNERYSAE